MPNIGLVEICGHWLTSVFSIADHCFISSETGGIFPRSHMARDCGLAWGFRFAFLNLAIRFSRQEAALEVRKSSDPPRFSKDSACWTMLSIMLAAPGQIGRASCRERVEVPVDDGGVERRDEG